MSQAQLRAKASSIRIGAAGRATGDITLWLEEVPFPAQSWNDFVVVVVTAWVDAHVRLLRGESSAERVHFMEGPYAIDIVRVGEGELLLSALERSALRQSLVVDSVGLVRDAAAVGASVVNACRVAGHRSSDLEALEDAMSSLRVEMRTAGLSVVR